MYAHARAHTHVRNGLSDKRFWTLTSVVTLILITIIMMGCNNNNNNINDNNHNNNNGPSQPRRSAN